MCKLFCLSRENSFSTKSVVERYDMTIDRYCKKTRTEHLEFIRIDSRDGREIVDNLIRRYETIGADIKVIASSPSGEYKRQYTTDGGWTN